MLPLWDGVKFYLVVGSRQFLCQVTIKVYSRFIAVYSQIICREEHVACARHVLKQITERLLAD